MLRTARSGCHTPAALPKNVFAQPVPVATQYAITDLGRRALRQYDARAATASERDAGEAGGFEGEQR